MDGTELNNANAKLNSGAVHATVQMAYMGEDMNKLNRSLVKP